MAGTRSSARLNGSSPSSSQQEKTSPQDSKRKDPPTSASPSAKRGKKGAAQKTLEETAGVETKTESSGTSSKPQGEEKPGRNGHANGEANGKADTADKDTQKDAEDVEQDAQAEAKADDAQADEKANGKADGKESDAQVATAKDSNIKNAGSEGSDAPETSDQNDAKKEDKPVEEGAIESSQGRGQKVPSNLLEKGIIYFFARGRVGIQKPAAVEDIARSYIVLRPLPKDAKISGEGALEDLKNNRLLAVPKKVLPQTHKDAFLVFVEKAQTTLKDLRDNFMPGSSYDTKTTGTSHTPPITPLAEGVYAITTQGRESHLAYDIVIPQDITEVQSSMGIKDKGSFVLSAKNPEASSPANASLPQGPGYPKEIMEEFAGRRWMGLQPHHLDYPNAQCLFIGAGAGEFGRAGEKMDSESAEKKAPEQEVEDLAGEEAHRAEQLKGDDTIFDDLGVSKKDYPQVKTTW